MAPAVTYRRSQNASSSSKGVAAEMSSLNSSCINVAASVRAAQEESGQNLHQGSLNAFQNCRVKLWASARMLLITGLGCIVVAAVRVYSVRGYKHFEQTFGLLKIHLGRRKAMTWARVRPAGPANAISRYQALGDRIELIPAGLIDEADY